MTYRLTELLNSLTLRNHIAGGMFYLACAVLIGLVMINTSPWPLPIRSKALTAYAVFMLVAWFLTLSALMLIRFIP